MTAADVAMLVVFVGIALAARWFVLSLMTAWLERTVGSDNKGDDNAGR